jgi:hypothetical protein
MNNLIGQIAYTNILVKWTYRCEDLGTYMRTCYLNKHPYGLEIIVTVPWNSSLTSPRSSKTRMARSMSWST